jgi:hypothetical protein
MDGAARTDDLPQAQNENPRRWCTSAATALTYTVPMSGKVKILFLAANPHAYTKPLRLDDELRVMTQAIRGGTARDALELVCEHAVRTSEVQEVLLRHRPQVVHFAGHGQGAAGICLGDEYGAPRTLSGDLLADLFAIVKPPVHVVLLNACKTLPTIEALHTIVDYVIGSSAAIQDDAAILFSSAFYGALANGATVTDAFDLGVIQLKVHAAPGAHLPTLLVREGVDESRTLLPPPAPPRDPEVNHGTLYRTVIGHVEGEKLVVSDDVSGGAVGDVHDRRIDNAKVRETLLETRRGLSRGPSPL